MTHEYLTSNQNNEFTGEKEHPATIHAKFRSLVKFQGRETKTEPVNLAHLGAENACIFIKNGKSKVAFRGSVGRR